MAEMGAANIKDPRGVLCRLKRIARELHRIELIEKLGQPGLQLPRVKGASHFEILTAKSRSGEKV
jgi:hypothetical protein